jgi:hypothetical protein
MRILIFLLLFISSSSSIAAVVGDQAPNIFGRTFDKEFFRLSKLQVPLLVNFFRVERAPCVKEMPEPAKLAKDFPRIQIISVHAGDEGLEAGRQFVDKLPAHPKAIVVASPKVKDKDMYDFTVLPYTVIVDEGIIADVILDYSENKGLSQIRKHLQEIQKRQQML